MNYIEIINLYWKLREQGILDAGCGDLYLYLVHKSNSLGWKNPFNQSNSLVRAFINVSEPTLIRQRNVLKQLGLIEFESGKALRSNTTYYLNNLSSVVSRHFSSDVSSVFSRVDEKPLDYTKQETKPNETKHEESADKPHSKNHSKKSNPGKGKEKSSEQKENPAEFKRKLIEYGFTPQLAEEWMLIRKKKKAINSDMAFENFIKEVEKCNKDPNEVLQIVVNKQWKGLEASWIKNISIQNFNNNGTGKSGNYQSAVERAQTVVGNLITNQNLQQRV